MRIGLFYDWDLTLNEEFPQINIFKKFFPKLQEKYGIKKPEDYWDLCKQSEFVVDYLERMIKDAKDTFGGLTNKIMEEEFAPMTKLAPGVEDWFQRINQFAERRGIELEHHIVSVGIAPLIKGTKIAKNFTTINACEFLDDQEGIYKIKRVIDPFRKVEFIKSICKGADLHKDIPLEEYNILHRHAIVFGDGQSDKDMFRYIHQRGGFSVAVFEDNNKKNFDKLVNSLNAEDPYKSSVNLIAPRDYSEGSRIDRKIKETIIEMKEYENKCTMDYELIHNFKHNHIRDKEIIKIVEKHFNSCKFCRKKFNPQIYLS